MMNRDVNCSEVLPETVRASKRKRQQEEEGVKATVLPAAALSDSTKQQSKRRRSYVPAEPSELGLEPVPGNNQRSSSLLQAPSCPSQPDKSGTELTASTKSPQPSGGQQQSSDSELPSATSPQQLPPSQSSQGSSAQVLQQLAPELPQLGEEDVTFEYETAADGTDNLQLLGKGGFARVYLVKSGGRSAALKVPHLHTDQAQASLQLCTEAQLLNSLRGPYTVEVIGWYQTEQMSGIVMEHMVHGDLRSKLQELGSNPESRLTLRQLLRILLRAAQALEKVHSVDIIHCDVKMANFLCDLTNRDDPVVKISDFGLSLTAEDAPSIKGIHGTWETLAPEQYPEELVRDSCAEDDCDYCGYCNGFITVQPHRAEDDDLSRYSGLDREPAHEPEPESESEHPDEYYGSIQRFEDCINKPGMVTKLLGPYKGRAIDTKIDVFGFGVAGWEILTHAHTKPYTDFPEPNKEVYAHKIVKKKVRPAIPLFWCSELRDLLKACWHPLPEKRPTMAVVVQLLEQLLERPAAELCNPELVD